MLRYDNNEYKNPKSLTYDEKIEIKEKIIDRQSLMTQAIKYQQENSKGLEKESREYLELKYVTAIALVAFHNAIDNFYQELGEGYSSSIRKYHIEKFSEANKIVRECKETAENKKWDFFKLEFFTLENESLSIKKMSDVKKKNPMGFY